MKGSFVPSDEHARAASTLNVSSYHSCIIHYLLRGAAFYFGSALSALPMFSSRVA